MTMNQPTLPYFVAAKTTIITIAGLALAVIPGKMATERPWSLVWLVMDGGALMLVLILATSVEDIAWWIEIGASFRLGMLVIGVGVGIVGLLILSALRRRFRVPMTGTIALMISGACVAYLLMPLVHRVLVTEFTNISSASNFFVGNGLLQTGIWLFSGAVAYGITQIRTEWMYGNGSGPSMKSRPAGDDKL